jgi:hypothetical protein
MAGLLPAIHVLGNTDLILRRRVSAVSKEVPESTGSSFETQPHGCSSG